MLKHLHVENFVLIEDLDIDFYPKMNALTGETGAGKSVLLTSLSMLLGKRTDATMIRHGAKKAFIEGRFLLPKHIQSSFSLEEEMVILREVDQSGRHQITLNGQSITLSYLKQLMKSLADIHQQDDTQLLMDEAFYLTLIDQSDEAEIQTLLASYLLAKSTYDELFKELKEIQKAHEESVAQFEYLSFQYEELEKLNLKENELSSLEETVEKMKHFDTHKERLVEINQILEAYPIDFLYDMAKQLEKLARIDTKYQAYHEVYLNSYYELGEINDVVKDDLQTLDFDEALFDQMQERVYALKGIEQKYHKSLSELIRYQAELSYKLNLFTDYEGTKKHMEEKLKKQHLLVSEKALALSKKRKKLALKLSAELLEELKDLDLEKANVSLEIESGTEFLETGMDHVNFMVSFNEGEPLRMLAKVASGGERSRVMLALKARYAKSKRLSLLILDEIDTGVSGKTAAKVAKKMAELADSMQVLLITHLPQVAAKADDQYFIYKAMDDNRMHTKIVHLTEEERIMKIAMMLSDEELTSYAIEQAKLMLRK